MLRRERYRAAARAIARYLAERQRQDGGFPGPDGYGIACSLWLWSYFGVEFARQLDRAWQRLKADPPESHGEFNVYALLHCRERLGARPVDALLRRLRFGRRHSANWMLLRSVCRARQGPFLAPGRSRAEARAVLLRYARRGLIHDRPNVRSFAYHAFCGALLADLWRECRAPWTGKAAVQAARFVAPFVLPNGDALYVGRGQEQIFGYGALLYLLEAGAQLTGERSFEELAERVSRRVLRFQRRDGSLPLVLREGEEAEPWLPDASRPGWYSYNRYADYLPFLGCMLLKAAEAELSPVESAEPPAQSPHFLVHEGSAYTAVVALPGGAPTNDLPFPYVCLGGECIFPCYGAEGDEAPPEAVPLPYGVLEGGQVYSPRDQLRYRIQGHDLIGESRLLRHVRTFRFRGDGFDCVDAILFRRHCTFKSFVPANFLFRTLRPSEGHTFETWHRAAKAHLRLQPVGSIHPEAAVSASGVLVALRHTLAGFRPRAGETVSAQLQVRFP
jgi:hypothetical protein